MSMIKEIEMYCSFGKDGTVIPIQFRIEDESNELHTFKIKRYKPLDSKNDLSMSYNGNSTFNTFTLNYDAVIENDGVERIVRLHYNIAQHKWAVKI